MTYIPLYNKTHIICFKDTFLKHTLQAMLKWYNILFWEHSI